MCSVQEIFTTFTMCTWLLYLLFAMFCINLTLTAWFVSLNNVCLIKIRSKQSTSNTLLSLLRIFMRQTLGFVIDNHLSPQPLNSHKAVWQIPYYT
jgi:hypothetical protein